MVRNVKVIEQPKLTAGSNINVVWVDSSWLTYIYGSGLYPEMSIGKGQWQPVCDHEEGLRFPSAKEEITFC